jgi:phytoene dehydrogenase-like protein
MSEKSIIIIGAGIAGLCTGVYAQANGYRSRIFEMHSLPGGLATAWKRRGYTIDGCIHWLVGSSPHNGLHSLWQEVGMLDGLTFVDNEIYAIVEDQRGRRLCLFVDPDRLEQEMLRLSPQDAAPIHEFCEGVRFFLKLNPPIVEQPGWSGWWNKIRFGLSALPKMSLMRRWMKTSLGEFAGRFQDPLLRAAIGELWYPEFAVMFMLTTFAWLSKKEGGYPVGGSLPMIHNVEKRYTELGGQITYDSRVEKILVKNDRAVGVHLVGGEEIYADLVISCADGHATIFDMLDGLYIDDVIRGYYRTFKPFPPILLIGVGVNRSFADEPQTVAGVTFETKPFQIGARSYQRLSVHPYNYDPTLAPAGKTLMNVIIETDYAYWKALRENKAVYEARKREIETLVIDRLETHWPGIREQIEMIDVATPCTFERYTGNWQASYEGWLMTTENALVRMKRTLPGLENFYMAGQWVMPGGGLPAGVLTARETVQQICRKDGRPFHSPIN